MPNLYEIMGKMYKLQQGRIVTIYRYDESSQTLPTWTTVNMLHLASQHLTIEVLLMCVIEFLFILSQARHAEAEDQHFLEV